MLHETITGQTNSTGSTTEDVLKHHQISIRNRDLSGLMADYHGQARLFTTDGILRGSAAIREFFAKLFEEFAKPGLSFERLRQDVEGETAYVVWKAETADNRYEFATDTFVVENGKIVTQTFAAKMSPKSQQI